VRGKWLKKGAHLDLVGAYTPKMRESDDDAVKARAGLCRYRALGAPRRAATSRSR
jgi:ornithine cyclodeaminase/alanine dehydrogenase-like protein (mu-crystallin family)